MANNSLDGEFAVDDVSGVESPSILLFEDRLRDNIRHMVDIAGSAQRLTPHCKTHKISRIVELLIEHGVTSHKCATIAEAEMLASAGASRVLLAYNPVGPNIKRIVALSLAYPQVHFAVTCDHLLPLQELAECAAASGAEIEVLLDINCGMNRTGVELGPAALELYTQIHALPGVKCGGLHIYDGHNRQADIEERRKAVAAVWEKVCQFKQQLQDADLPCPRQVAGGTGSFPVYAELDVDIELSPGTVVFYDAGYTRAFPDLPFKPAAVVLTRVVSRPAPDTLTLDVGNKAVASDPPAGKRLYFPALPDAEEVMHSEEHLVLRMKQACDLQPGTPLIAVPVHICPTSALHEYVHTVSDGKIRDRWAVTARNRKLTV